MQNSSRLEGAKLKRKKGIANECEYSKREVSFLGGKTLRKETLQQWSSGKISREQYKKSWKKESFKQRFTTLYTH